MGYFIMLNDSLKLNYLSTSSIYLFVQSLVTFLILADFTSKAKAVSASLLIILLSLVIETIGVQTGFPFGSYEYTKVLSPIFPGGVPLAIAFAWMTLSVNSFIILKYFLKNKNKYFVIFLSGLLIA
ncbi:MAG: carotenoid biosynthesis protein, partial [Ignavibacteria bacterium]|nr:carotenoid biosynthesis protein [Ignavibacteria bacterium]